MKLVGLIVVLVFSACGKKERCVPGASQSCTGAGGCTGFQVCKSDGSGLGACECGSAKADTESRDDEQPEDKDDPPEETSEEDAASDEEATSEPDAAVEEVDVPDANTTSPMFAKCSYPQEDRNRDCGWTGSETFECTAGTKFRVACSSQCDLGSCTGDTIMRACPGGKPCDFDTAIGSSDGSGCGGGECSSGTEDCCSALTSLNCPSSGEVTIVWGPFRSSDRATCRIEMDPCSTTESGCE